MALAGGNILPLDLSTNYVLVGVAGVALFAVGIFKLHGEAEQKRDEIDEVPGLFRSMLLFCYSCFIKPHAAGSDGTQQAHLESFYASQSGVYDTTRKPLLKGREDMLALVAAQLRFKAQKDGKPEENDGDEKRKRIWVDVLQSIAPPSPALFALLRDISPPTDPVRRFSLGGRRNRLEH